MPNVLILGATGSVGLPLAQSLVRSGAHVVYGLARSAAKARLLAQHEVVRGDAGDPAAWTPALAAAPIDVVVDASSAYAHAATILAAVTDFARERAATLAAEDLARHARPAFVYVSGTWIHGASRGPVSDATPVGSATLSRDGTPAAATAWRVQHEQHVLAAGAGADAPLDTAVVRLAQVYGGSSWLWAPIFKPLLAAAASGTEEAVAVPLDRTARAAVVHVDDGVAGLHAAVERVGGGRLGAWPVFDLVAETVGMPELVAAVRAARGVKGEADFVGTGGDALLDAMNLRQDVRADRAATVLGWVPRRRALVRDIERVLAAFEAHVEG